MRFVLGILILFCMTSFAASINEEPIELQGTVTEVFPNSTYKVTLEDEREMMAHISDALRIDHVRINHGDTVTVEITPYYLIQGCIISKKINRRQI